MNSIRTLDFLPEPPLCLVAKAQQNHLLTDLEDVFGKNRAAVLLSLAIFFASDPAPLPQNLRSTAITLGCLALP